MKIGTLQQSDYSQDYFDAITLFHVFEHLDKPKETLEIICKILKEDGLLVMSFPNIASWQAKMFDAMSYQNDLPPAVVELSRKTFAPALVALENHF